MVRKSNLDINVSLALMTVAPKAMKHYERYRDIVDDFDAFMNTLITFPPIYIRVNTLKVDMDSLIRKLEARWIDVFDTPLDVGLKVDDKEVAKTLEYALGYYYIQDLASMAVAYVLDPRCEHTVLDLCAAPGGKTTHMAQLMDNRGLIIANDVVLDRLYILIGHLNRLGIANTVVTRMNGASHKYIGRADRILVDAPCSSEGTIRKNWSVLNRINLGLIRKMAGIQRHMLISVIQKAKKDTVIVYATCTFAPEENEWVVNEALKTGLVEIEKVNTPLKHSKGITKWIDEKGYEYRFDKALERAVRIYPHYNDSGGMFIAKLRRI